LSQSFNYLKLRGAQFRSGENFVQVEPTQELTPIKCETQPYPGIPTDVQAQLMALSLVIPGESHIVEAIFENRFMHVPELTRMGAEIELDGSHARINQSKMIGAPVMCTDLRASAALILAALVADGETEINRIYHLDRGYEKLAQKFEKLGANIKRVKA
jgi:UDP-N-acetylglucosamine 1-carboxyvinyltransferase